MLAVATLDINIKTMYIHVFWSAAEKIAHLERAHSAGRARYTRLT